MSSVVYVDVTSFARKHGYILTYNYPHAETLLRVCMSTILATRLLYSCMNSISLSTLGAMSLTLAMYECQVYLYPGNSGTTPNVLVPTALAPMSKG